LQFNPLSELKRQKPVGQYEFMWSTILMQLD